MTAEHAASAGSVAPPPGLPTYRIEYLEWGVAIEDGGHPVLNPRNIHATSLLEVDKVWRQDMGWYRQYLEHKRKKAKE